MIKWVNSTDTSEDTCSYYIAKRFPFINKRLLWKICACYCFLFYFNNFSNNYQQRIFKITITHETNYYI